MMDDVDIQNALLYKVIDLSLSLVECLLHLRNILEPKPEYWSEFIEPYLREMEERRKDVLERYRQKYDGKMVMMKFFAMYRRNLIAWNVMTSSGNNVSRTHDILLNSIMQYTVDVH